MGKINTGAKITGVVFALVFLSYALLNIYYHFNGEWSAPMLTAMVTFPFSVGVDYAIDATSSFGLGDHEALKSAEMWIIAVVGVLEFYLIGYIIGRIVMARRSSDSE
jgi:hypothetical protein